MYKVVSFHLIKFQIILLESVSEVLAGLREASKAGSAGGQGESMSAVDTI